MPGDYHYRLGDILIAAGVITAEQLNEALALQKESTMKLGELLIHYGWITEEGLTRALARQFGHPYLPGVDTTLVDPAFRKLIPERIVRENLVFPYERDGNVLRVVMADPTNLFLLDDLRAITGFKKIEVLLTTPTQLRKAIDEFYGSTETMSALLGEIDEDVEVVENLEDQVSAAELRAQVEDTPIIRMVNVLIKEALQANATDIHLEPYEQTFRIRYRIDGILHEVPSPPKKYQNAILSRLKIMADLDIAERRLPQDGRFKLRLANREVDFRISTLPTAFGEKVVLRILDKTERIEAKTGSISDLEQLGLTPPQVETVKRSLFRPHGMILVTGPTGSGKTTTLYACLEILNSPEKNIVTVEDPVEYMIPGINQVPAHPQIGLNFAKVLRSILRQDPDVIMVGEIRDQETAEIAINAALTGHLVLSTLHTNDAPGAVVRLENMGIEPFLITSTLLLTISQRLMRKICPECKEPYTPPPELVESMRLETLPPEGTFFRGRGCEACSNTGYRGRVGVYELLEITEDVKAMVLKRMTSSAIKSAAIEKGFRTLRQASLDLVFRGLTTLEEVWRVSTEDFLVGE
ncbi:MAG: type II secretion system protein GspE [Candidatus Hydrogenedentota bacterium]|nr:MAG: type II secretion system protein GspE [Candidatus Hydrogenedentota bacterium]